MGKAKRNKQNRAPHNAPYAQHQQHAKSKNKSKPGATDSTSHHRQSMSNTTTASAPAPNHARPTIPFSPHDRILLVGEGDFSFSYSLVSTHGCAAVLATCYDAEKELYDKYPQALANIDYLRGEDQRVLFGVDAMRLGGYKEIRGRGRRRQRRNRDKEREGNSEDGEEEEGDDEEGKEKVGGEQEENTSSGWDRIIFNFPHVGGKSTDVNRQVRYNQELLVKFFTAAKPLLSPTGTIIVTLFEGEPYTLWNVRDLARHAGLKVGVSFRFQSEAYPEYKHARTVGNIEGGGGWKGETRGARTYIFEKVEGGVAGGGGEGGNALVAGKNGKSGKKGAAAGKHKKVNKKQRAGGDDDSTSDED